MSFMPYVSPDQLMKDRSEYAHKGIARGRSVIGLEIADGLLFIAENPSSTLHKISEIYDRIAFAGVGKYSEFEDLRIAGIRLADLRGYSYGREDVKARDLANAYSQALSTIFTQQMKPYEVEILVGEVNGEVDGTSIYHVLFDGSVTDEHGFVAIGGHADELTEELKERYSARLGPRDGREDGRPGAGRAGFAHDRARSHRVGRPRAEPDQAPEVPPAHRRRDRRLPRRLSPDLRRATREARVPVTASVGWTRGAADLRTRERVRRDLHVPRTAPPVPGRGRALPLPPRRALGSVLQRVPRERGAAVPRRRFASRVRDAGMRRRRGARRPRQGGGADPRGPPGSGRAPPPRGGHLGAGVPLQEQHRLGGELLRLSRELPRGPAR